MSDFGDMRSTLKKIFVAGYVAGYVASLQQIIFKLDRQKIDLKTHEEVIKTAEKEFEKAF